MSLYSRHNPATYDLTGMTEQQFTALREALVILHQRPLPTNCDSDDFETARLNHLASIELLDATNAALRRAKGIDDD